MNDTLFDKIQRGAALEKKIPAINFLELDSAERVEFIHNALRDSASRDYQLVQHVTPSLCISCGVVLDIPTFNWPPCVHTDGHIGRCHGWIPADTAETMPNYFRDWVAMLIERIFPQGLIQ